jgi:uncharacterized protein
MSRLLILGIILFFVVYYVRRKWRSGEQNRQTSHPEKNEKMVKCAHCGVHVPVSEAIPFNDEFYCSDAHKPHA